MEKAKLWLRFSVFYIYKVSNLEVTISRVPSPGAKPENVTDNWAEPKKITNNFEIVA